MSIGGGRFYDARRQKLAALVSELKSRGLQIPPELLEGTQRHLTWPLSERGYFHRIDSKEYNPSEKQEAFVKSTAVLSAFMGGRGCIAPETMIGDIPIADRKSYGVVDTLYGKYLSTPGYLKGKDCLYSVKTLEGAEALVTGHHRFLTLAGWIPLNQLQVGDLILSDGTWHVRIGKEIKSNFQDYYSLRFHLNDELRILSERVALDILQQLHKTVYENSAWVHSYFLSIADSLARLLFRLFVEYSISLISYEQLLHQYLGFFQSHLFPHHSNISEQPVFYPEKLFLGFDYVYLFGHQSEFCIFSQCFGHIFQKDLDLLPQFLRAEFLEFVELLHHGLFLDVYQVSSSLPPLNAYNYTSFFDSIVDIKFIRVGEFYDLTVPYFEHYSAGGLYHHNSGKTAAGAQKALIKIKQGESGAVFNPDFENLKTSTWPELRQWIPWDLVIPKHQYRKEESFQPLQPFRLVFKNKAWMLIKGLKSPDSARGPNINWLWYDEPARDLLGLSWMIALAAVRVGKDPQAWITGTPGGREHWIYEFFVKKNIPQDALEMFTKLQLNRNLIDDVYFGSIYDNQKNLNPVFMATMLATYHSGYLRRQEIFGEFVSPGGSLGDRLWFDGKVLESPPENAKIRVRYYDLAATEKKMMGDKILNDPDETVGTLMSYTEDNRFVIEHQVGAFVEWDGLLNLIRDTAMQDGPTVKIVVEQEAASGGKNQVAAIAKYLKEQLPGWPIDADKLGWRPDQDRVILANVWFGEASRGLFYIVKGAWNEPFLSCLDGFPDVRHDDRVTSVTGARISVAPLKTWKDIDFRFLGQQKEEKKEEEKAPIVGI